MATQKLATIEKVDLRDIWPNEASNFTPWLAENLSALGEALGLDLELQAQEAQVGAFSLDLLARDTGTNRPVIIENQLEATDHDHLGKLLTYASGYDANVIVWITREFKEEHRQALDWLNQRTGEDTVFFGVAVELWKIDESRPAVNFNLVTTPNEWQKQAVSSARATGNVSERMERYRAFFQGLIDTLREEHRFTNARKGQPQSWYYFSSGHGGSFVYSASFARGNKARVEVYIDSGEKYWNEQRFHRLMDIKEEIESELGGTLEWERLDDRRACRISAVRPGSIDDDTETLEEIRGWMTEKLLAFKQVFGPRLAELVG